MPAKKKTIKRKPSPACNTGELEARLAEAEETLRAIREGEVDAVVVSGSKGQQVFSLVGSDSIYRMIVETMKGAAFTLTFEGKILFSNAQFGQLIQRPLEQIIGHALREFVAPASHGAAATFLLAAQQQGVKERLVFQTADGTPVPARVASNILHQPDGLSICVVANDLTELENSTHLVGRLRRQQEALQAANEELAATEEELRVQNDELSVSRADLERARARYQDLFETAPDGYLVTDGEGTIQEVNQAAARLLGCPGAELRGNPFSALVAADQKDDYLERLRSLHAGAGPLPLWEVEIQPVAGKRFWAAVSVAASYDEQAHIVGLRWLIHDITDRKEAERKVRTLLTVVQEEKERLACLVKSISDEVWFADTSRKFTLANPSALGEFRLGSADEIDIEKFAASLEVYRADATPRPVEEAPPLRALAGEIIRAEDEIIRTPGTGELRYRQVSSSPVRDAKGQIIGSVSVVRDMTERKRAEEALRKTTEELRRSNKDLESFAAVASHDLQEPLRMVGGFLALLRDEYQDKLDDKARQHIRYASDGAARMSALVRDLLEYARVTAKDHDVAPVDLAVVADETKAVLRASIEEAKAVVTADPLPVVTADPVQMRQLLQNLLANAIKFRDPGRQPRVHIGARKANGQWHIQVQDNGIGIAPEHRDRVFEVFQRLHARDQYPGTGVGLAICKKIVDRHAGRIWVESEPGKGSTFCFSLPVI